MDVTGSLTGRKESGFYSERSWFGMTTLSFDGHGICNGSKIWKASRASSMLDWHVVSSPTSVQRADPKNVVFDQLINEDIIDVTSTNVYSFR